MSKENKKVLLGMSGGTDSSVAAMRLLEMGYEVTGVTFRFYELHDDTGYLDDARTLAERLGIEHITYDARPLFRQTVVDYFVREYMAGHTPVPCTLCNNLLKWPLLAQLADERGIRYIATGHYARKVCVGETCYLTYAADRDKDQTFFLWGLPQEIVQRMLLPMGEITKSEARAMAAGRGFHRVAEKRDSLGVCFCPMDYRSFLRNYLPDAGVLQRGRFVDEDGTFLGWHEGYPFYTIGQRRGLGIHLNRPVFVKEIHPSENVVVLSSDYSSLEKNRMLLTDCNVVNPSLLLDAPDVTVKIRYRKQENRCVVSLEPDERLSVRLLEPLASIAPGQAAAFYRDDLLIGGGIIVSSCI